MKITWERVLLIVLALVLVFQQTCHNKDLDKKDEKITELLKNQTLDSIKNALGKKVYVQEMIETNQATIRTYTDSIFNLKKKHAKEIKSVIAFYTERTKTVIDSVDVPFIDTMAQKRFSDSVEKVCADVIKYYRDSSLLIGTSAKDSTANYKIDVTLLKDSSGRKVLHVNEISTIDSQYIRISLLKGGFLKKDQHGKRKLFLRKSYRIEVMHTSSLVTVKGANSIIYTPPRKGDWLGRALGVAIGFILTKNL